MSNCPYCDPDVEEFLCDAAVAEALKKKQYAEDLDSAVEEFIIAFKKKKQYAEDLKEAMIRMKFE